MSLYISEFQNPSFHVLRRRLCPCQYFTTVFVIALVPVTVTTYLDVICWHLFHLSYNAISRPCHLGMFSQQGLIYATLHISLIIKNNGNMAYFSYQHDYSCNKPLFFEHIPQLFHRAHEKTGTIKQQKDNK